MKQAWQHCGRGAPRRTKFSSWKVWKCFRIQFHNRGEANCGDAPPRSSAGRKENKELYHEQQDASSNESETSFLCAWWLLVWSETRCRQRPGGRDYGLIKVSDNLGISQTSVQTLLIANECLPHTCKYHIMQQYRVHVETTEGEKEKMKLQLLFL